MKPRVLRLSAFMSFPKTTTVDFTNAAGNFFLIFGPTGSGKTALLDAICFALYGDSSMGSSIGAGGRAAKELRCQYAAPDVPTEVTLRFAIGSQEYLVIRNPEYSRPALRGSGTTLQRAGAELSIVDTDGRVSSLVSGVGEVTKRIEALLGLTDEQFRQVMVIPQGRFRELLTAGTPVRRAILEELFPIAVYKQFVARAENLARELGSELATVNTRKATLLARFEAQTAEHLQELLTSAETAVTAAQTAKDAAVRAVALAEQQFAAATEVQRQFAAADAARTHLAAVRAQEPQVVVLKERRDRSYRAQQVAPVAARAAAAAAELQAAAQAVPVAQAAVAAARAAHAGAKAAAAEADAALSAGAPLERTIAAWQLVRSDAAALETHAAGDRTCRARLRAAGEQAAGCRDHVQSAQTRLERATVELDRIKADADRLPAVLNRLDLLQRWEHATAAAAAADDRLANCRNNAQTLTSDMDGAAASISRRTAELERLNRLWSESAASRLAQQLSAGAPCPVCGSLHHPAPAESREPLPTEDQIARQRQELRHDQGVHQDLAQQLQTVQQAAVRAEADGENARTQLAALRAAGAEAVAAGASEIAAGEVAALQAERDRATAARDHLAAAQQRLGECRDAVATALAAAADADADERTAATAAATAAAGLDALRARLPAGVNGVAALDRKILAAEQRLAALKDAVEVGRSALIAAGSNLSGAEAGRTLAEQQAQQRSEAAALITREFDAAVAAAGFADREAYATAAADVNEFETITGSIERFDQQLFAARESERAATAAVAQLAPIDMATVTAERTAAQAALDASTTALARVQQRALDMRQVLDAIVAADKAAEAPRRRHQVATRLHQIAHGTQTEYNPKRLPLADYVLSSYLDEVLAAANNRLNGLSEGRFALRRFEADGSGRAANGLDIMVDDAWSGQTRRAATLSGGESFAAALSLALGMGDVVQSLAGGKRLDMLFLDEGFGTLDEQALETAIGSLLQLRDGNKLIGIISHVRELRDAIDCRLEVRKREPPVGSDLHWHLP